MAGPCAQLTNFLDENSVKYEVIHHAADYTAQEAAHDTHTPGIEFAKTVFACIDGRYAMVVLPAHRRVNWDHLRTALNATDVGLAKEEEMVDLCPDCDVGAEPPFGNLYGLPVYVSSEMMGDEHITFNAGTHEDAIRLRMDDYQRLVQPQVMDLSMPA
ncbi:MAG: YbaK/EbsC family protein [Deltaproteobacteria bacterium]|nr:MAG: YbaK/EbsC family protein [Deltaproteobacteria bacterium]